ncbi:MAG: hypothetical protein ACLP7Q_04980 [Isosphaeraceae bacterium]
MPIGESPSGFTIWRNADGQPLLSADLWAITKPALPDWNRVHKLLR